ncbi:MAG: tetratricopeptide repeat protein [Acidobacteria bacterium]|nr:tetratricopeptide repeat protein [Acidobacteriota bacterium]
MALRSPLITRALLFLVAAVGAPALHADNRQALQLLNQGRVDEAAAMLTSSLSSQPHDALAHQLLCRVYYAQDMGDAAVRECELATQDDASNSTHQLWLGRAYGLKASQANMVSAFTIAKKVHLAFERAIQLDPSNVAAMSDLGQFYVNAPAIVGGGLDKAQTLAGQLLPRSAARGHRLLAQIAQKKNDQASAEAEFKSAIAAARTPDAWVDLALFYQQHAQPEKAVTAVQTSIEANRPKSAALVDAASILTDLHRQTDMAERSLREYLGSAAKTDDAPAFKVHLQLGDLLKQRGDIVAARREYAAALALASKYPPALKATQGA